MHRIAIRRTHLLSLAMFGLLALVSMITPDLAAAQDAFGLSTVPDKMAAFARPIVTPVLIVGGVVLAVFALYNLAMAAKSGKSDGLLSAVFSLIMAVILIVGPSKLISAIGFDSVAVEMAKWGF
jgi:hypothetical protein